MSSAAAADKVRFDLKQISQWDKQNKQDYEKKVLQKGTGGSSGRHHHSVRNGSSNAYHDQDDVTTGSGYKYRDRALERRKDLNGLVSDTLTHVEVMMLLSSIK